LAAFGAFAPDASGRLRGAGGMDFVPIFRPCTHACHFALANVKGIAKLPDLYLWFAAAFEEQ
jgi:hypothetical protein